jgi:hypothetical protein
MGLGVGVRQTGQGTCIIYCGLRALDEKFNDMYSTGVMRIEGPFTCIIIIH